MTIKSNFQNSKKQLQKYSYDLVDRTTKFGQSILIFCKSISANEISKPLISQIVRSGTSIGANYREANCAISKRDFIHKINLCKKEANETEHWLIMLSTIFPELKDNLRVLWQENHELTMIFSKIQKSSMSKALEIKHSKID